MALLVIMIAMLFLLSSMDNNNAAIGAILIIDPIFLQSYSNDNCNNRNCICAFEIVILFMPKKLNSVFKKEKNIIIGAIHFPPLLGFKNFPGFELALKNALKDLRALEKGGADAAILENIYEKERLFFFKLTGTYLLERRKNYLKKD